AQYTIWFSSIYYSRRVTTTKNERKSRHGSEDTTTENENKELDEVEGASSEDGIKDSSPEGDVRDNPILLLRRSLSKESSPDSLGYVSAPTSPRSSILGADGVPDPLLAHHWRDFFRVFKKGNAVAHAMRGNANAMTHAMKGNANAMTHAMKENANAMSHAINAKRIQTSFPPVKKVIPRLTRRTILKAREASAARNLDPLPAGEFCYFKSSWKNFSLREIQDATKNFSPDFLIGQGGYAEVYKGNLEDGQVVAIKRLTRGSPEEMTIDFLSELGIMVHVDHPNIARLIGYGEKLNWETRYKIALGTADGLYYLHEECQRRIIHKDIKAANILLSEDFDPQISDFGLAKWLPEEWTHHTVEKIEGTFGYLPPEFFMHGIVDEKTDVFAYGVLLLELITGRQALDSSQQSLVMWAKPLLKKNRIRELIDPTIGKNYDLKQMDRLLTTAYMCVVRVLKGDENSLKYMKLQAKSKHQRVYSEELGDAEEYNSTKCLTDTSQNMLELENSDAFLSKDYSSNRTRLMQLAFDHAEV
ncbi:hypothetical protein Tsubulata_032509, partial [Turnera subulata]